MSESRPDERYGGIAAVLAHPDDESFSCAGALALAHDAHRAVRLLVATRGEAGTPTASRTRIWPSAARTSCAAPPPGSGWTR